MENYPNPTTASLTYYAAPFWMLVGNEAFIMYCVILGVFASISIAAGA
jgi:hypothetical protein